MLSSFKCDHIILSNILLEKYENVKISNLGLVKSSSIADARDYTSPEVLNKKVYSYKADVW